MHPGREPCDSLSLGFMCQKLPSNECAISYAQRYTVCTDIALLKMTPRMIDESTIFYSSPQAIVTFDNDDNNYKSESDEETVIVARPSASLAKSDSSSKHLKPKPGCHSASGA